MSNRPPLKAARDAAVKTVLANHKDEYEAAVAYELKERGWEQKSETVTRWRLTND